MHANSRALWLLLFWISDSHANVALGKAVFQSNDNSFFSFGKPELAVDGFMETSKYACSNNRMDRNDPWWAVDLANIYELYEVRLTNVLNQGKEP